MSCSLAIVNELEMRIRWCLIMMGCDQDIYVDIFRAQEEDVVRGLNVLMELMSNCRPLISVSSKPVRREISADWQHVHGAIERPCEIYLGQVSPLSLRQSFAPIPLPPPPTSGCSPTLNLAPPSKDTSCPLT